MTYKKLAGLLAAVLVAASCSTTQESDLSGMSFSDEPLPGKIIWHDLITHDMAAAQRFYGELFGLDVRAACKSGRPGLRRGQKGRSLCCRHYSC